MARKFDSGWRDSRLNLIHHAWGHSFPAAGMTFPTLEYDRGEAVAVVNYIRRDVAALPKGDRVGHTYAAFSALRGPLGAVLPFITVQYDPRNWAMQLFAHNAPAAVLLGIDERSWLPCTEQHFVRLLYRLRGRQAPDLAARGVDLSTAPWLRLDGELQPQGWDGQDMSARRRAYEPEGNGVRFSHRNPCSDIDLAVIGRRSGQVALVVDYKLDNAYVVAGHKTHQAMSGLMDGLHNSVPSMITRYTPSNGVSVGWRFEVLPLNTSARALLHEFMVGIGALAYTSRAVEGWTSLAEHQWADLLDRVRDSR